ncbi:ribonuclease III [Dolosicoccus paucivorans]|uniref:Ribonuclease 3 n=1 Tax=Dolosicoccus paucivorans TaxID=84521 RepID=A0A1G8M2G6_9LACT|nr:ribonuclease III [Dolosicoccus paucivorans]PMB84280.1 ribonuclease III [Dolosicoccus paucivorans]PMC57960.1 ribonuclease III [Dolosicoccus paucivorans]SDI62043.1 ribonuclease-3 [Dolosicoccus paucivorans]
MSLTTFTKLQFNIIFHHKDLLKTAFRHTSYVNENASRQYTSNERLEFLGDAVIEIVVSDYLYNRYPKEPEGVLSRMRAQLVCEASLAFLAKENHLDQYLQLGRGEENNGGRKRDSILADCFEAFIGAIYLDQGIEKASDLLNDIMLNQVETLLNYVTKDYKTLYQEAVQTKGQAVIRYELLDQTGPDHNREFTIGLFLNDEQVATGKGRNKKQAETQAAQKAYHQWMEREACI